MFAAFEPSFYRVFLFYAFFPLKFPLPLLFILYFVAPVLLVLSYHFYRCIFSFGAPPFSPLIAAAFLSAGPLPPCLSTTVTSFSSQTLLFFLPIRNSFLAALVSVFYE